MILTIWCIAGLAYFGYLGLGFLFAFIYCIYFRDWKELWDILGCALWLCGWLGFLLSFWAILVGYGFTWLTYHEVDIIKEGNIVAACLFIGSIFAVKIGGKIKDRRLIENTNNEENEEKEKQKHKYVTLKSGKRVKID